MLTSDEFRRGRRETAEKRRFTMILRYNNIGVHYAVLQHSRVNIVPCNLLLTL